MLLRRIGEGQRAALQELYHLYSKPLYSYALKILGNQQDAEEVVQDAFVRYWKKAAKYDRSRSKPFAWAVMILRGICFDRLRQRKKLSHPPTLQDSEKSLGKTARSQHREPRVSGDRAAGAHGDISTPA